MKIFRFRAPGTGRWAGKGRWHVEQHKSLMGWCYADTGHSYAYIRANWFERIMIRARIAAGDWRIKDITDYHLAPGPRNYRAQFIICASPPSSLEERVQQARFQAFLEERRLAKQPASFKHRRAF